VPTILGIAIFLILLLAQYFVEHEEAIASELVGIFFHDRGLHPKSYLFSVNSAECYKKWGALAVVARQVENTIRSNFGSDTMMNLQPSLIH